MPKSNFFAVTEDEDWTKLTSISARRRIQNRLAQRHRRKMLKYQQQESNLQAALIDTYQSNAAQRPEQLIWINDHAVKAAPNASKRKPSGKSDAIVEIPENAYQIGTYSTSKTREVSPNLELFPEGSSSLMSPPLMISPGDPLDFRNFAMATPTQTSQEGGVPQLDPTQHEFWYQSMMVTADTGELLLNQNNAGLPTPPESIGSCDARIQHDFLGKDQKLGSGDFMYVSNDSLMDFKGNRLLQVVESDEESLRSDNSTLFTSKSSVTDRSNDLESKEFVDSLWQDESGNQQSLISGNNQQSVGGGRDSGEGLGTYGYTALHLAAQRDHVSIIRLLLASGFDINTRNEEGQSALHVSVMTGSEAAAQVLLENGTDCNLRSNIGQTALHAAVGKGSVNLVKLLLDNACDHEIRDTMGHSAFHCAVVNGHEEIVRLMLTRGAASSAKVGKQSNR